MENGNKYPEKFIHDEKKVKGESKTLSRQELWKNSVFTVYG